MPDPAVADSAVFTIGELATEFGVTTRTIRFYEDQGLLAPKRQGRNRVYDRRDRTRLKLALRGKRLGFALSEIREILDLFDSPQGEEQQLIRYLEALDNHRTQLEQQLSETSQSIGFTVKLADSIKRLKELLRAPHD